MVVEVVPLPAWALDEWAVLLPHATASRAREARRAAAASRAGWDRCMTGVLLWPRAPPLPRRRWPHGTIGVSPRLLNVSFASVRLTPSLRPAVGTRGAGRKRERVLILAGRSHRRSSPESP